MTYDYRTLMLAMQEEAKEAINKPLASGQPYFRSFSSKLETPIGVVQLMLQRESTSSRKGFGWTYKERWYINDKIVAKEAMIALFKGLS